MAEKEYFVQGAETDAAVITANITNYLGPGAKVKRGTYQNPVAGSSQDGGHRNLTTEMPRDLKRESERCKIEREQRPVSINTNSSYQGDPKESVEEIGEAEQSPLTDSRSLRNTPNSQPALVDDGVPAQNNSYLVRGAKPVHYPTDEPPAAKHGKLLKLYQRPSQAVSKRSLKSPGRKTKSSQHSQSIRHNLQHNKWGNDELEWVRERNPSADDLETSTELQKRRQFASYETSGTPATEQMPVIEHVIPNRKDLPLLLNGRMCRARADFGATRNIISTDFANKSGIRFELDDTCQPFELPTFGTLVWPIGRAWITCQFLNEPLTADIYEFFVFESFVYEAVMGRKFLRNTETLDKYRNRLHDRPLQVHDVPIVAFIGGKEDILRFWLDGEELESTPDTGSEVNVMSWDFARTRGFPVENDGLTCVRFANGSCQNIIGKVTIPVSFGNGTPPQILLKLVDSTSGYARPSPQITCGPDGEVNYGKTASILADFYILEGLNVEIILGEDILATVNPFAKHHADFKHVTTSINVDSGSCNRWPDQKYW